MEQQQKFFARMYAHVKRHWITISFILGFISDNIVLHRIDQALTNTILATYTFLTMFSNIALYAGISGRFSPRVNEVLKTYAPLVMQFVFGGVLSGMLIFYSRSGSLVGSWPYLLLIIAVIFGNETIKNRGHRLVYNLSIIFVGLFSYVELVVPVIIGKMGDVVFIGSGMLALFIMSLFFKVLTFVVPNFIALQKRNVVFTIGLIFVLFNTLYFTNLIPPIPLALKDSGVFHSVIRMGEDTYVLSYEKPAWWRFWKESDSRFHYAPGDNVYCYASVFAPTRLATDIYDRWEYYDETEKKWVEHGRYSYPITGGREDGYRGYTQIANVHDGKWRCTIETPRGQILGRETFTIISGVKQPLVTRTEQ